MSDISEPAGLISKLRGMTQKKSPPEIGSPSPSPEHLDLHHFFNPTRYKYIAERILKMPLDGVKNVVLVSITLHLPELQLQTSLRQPLLSYR